MNPIKFDENNCVFAENQKEYLTLPVHKTEDGVVISCWGLTWAERFKILIKGRIWLSILTFNNPLQPLYLSADSPFSQTVKKD